MNVPLGPKITEQIRLFVLTQNIKFSEEQIRKLVLLANFVWTDRNKTHDLLDCHALLFDPSPDAGKLRRSALLSDRCQLRDYPHWRSLPTLVARCFWPLYTQAVAARVPDGIRPVDFAWYIGALLRSIHPFVTGNLVLSVVIENQLRLLYGLPVSMALRPKAEFDSARFDMLLPHLGKM